MDQSPSFRSFLGEQKNLLQIILVSKNKLSYLEKYPNHHSLYRHLVESIGKSASSGLKHLKKTHGESFSLTKSFIKGQLLMLSFAHHIDEIAFPMQKMGIPIICQDIPKIEIDRINI